MAKYVHVWEVECNHCHGKFEHVFRASDILRPHVFNELLFQCPLCGSKAFDPVRPLGKYSRDEWVREHGDKAFSDLPEYE
ncbi:hypothetical protein GCM10007108_15150 [Thermogymnomonas acidicola]|uniref:Uncharacterized protein n=1 Tax=Thermogymnomonas acidicola TaxID=399579 RepID=A0AA37F9X7_9ARCH|nr:hypothetical protein [Thermogymnomonas acidicola]GGM77914.1 hypothetical protein GCM10007108_15150 [Thermogymnomonas acidicola]